ncbi:MAG TPA: FAD-dependent oxidoreductase, partial [Chloroflexota bacterium]|nr:FAD-dependent oxidoreductase [Chloroflexota bacterium]
MREQARVVIIGAGIVGCSAAYHLTKLGWREVVVIEQGPLFATGGSSSHAPGLMFQLNASRAVTQLARYSAGWYAELYPEGEPAFRRVGSLEVATTPERWQDLKRKQGQAMSWGLEAHLIGAQEAAHKMPLLRTERLHGALYVPSDGAAQAVRLAEAAARAAEERGAAFYGHTQVTGIE